MRCTVCSLPTITTHFLARGDSGVQKISVKKHPGAGKQRQDHCRVFASLGFMYGDRISQLKLVKLAKWIGDDAAFIKLHGKQLREGIDFFDNAGVAVENADTFIDGEAVFICNLPTRSDNCF